MTASAEESRRRVPLRVRLFAWWQGYDPNDIYTGDPVALEFDTAGRQAEAETAARTPRSTKVALWTAERIAVVEKLWGPSLHTPGGEEHLLSLLGPFGLNPTMNVLEFGAGLGGAARVMSKHFGCWVTGLEPSKVLADCGMERSREAGLEKRVPVEHVDPGRLRLREQGYNCIFAKEAFFTVPDKATLFDALVQALRPGGQLGFTDYVLPESSEPTPRVEEWRASEPMPPAPWSSQAMVDALARAGLEVRVAEDITDMHQAMILQGWRELTRALTPGSVAPEIVPHLVQEAELWARRGAVLRTEEIRVYRFHAVKAADPVA